MSEQISAKGAEEPEDFLDESPFRSSLRTVLLVDLALLSVWAAWSHPGPRGVGRLLLVTVWSLPALWTLITNPVLRKLAVRRMKRQPRESLFILSCVLVITTLLTLTISLSDSIVRSARDAVDTTFGSVDELVTAPTPDVRLDAQARLNDALAEKSETVNDLSLLVRGQLGLVSADMVFRYDGAESDAAHPAISRSVHVIEMDVDAAQNFGLDPKATGLAGRTNPGPGRVFVGPYAADALGVRAGSIVAMVSPSGEELKLQVEAILPRKGFGVLPLDGVDASRVAIVPIGTLTTLGSPPPLQYVIAISNREGSKSADAVVEHLERTFAAVAASDAPDGQSRPAVNVSIDNVKTQILAKAAARTEPLGRILRTMVWLLGLGSGVLLLALFFGLAVVRNAEIGALRSVGLRRRDAVSAFGLEGWFYAILGSIAGALVGFVSATLVLRRSFGTSGVAAAATAPKVESVLIGMSSGFTLTCFALALSLFVTTHGTVRGSVRNLRRSADRSQQLSQTGLTLAAAAVVSGFLCIRSIHDRGSFTFLMALLIFTTTVGLGWREVVLSGRTLPVRVNRPVKIAVAGVGLLILGVLPSLSARWFRHTGTGTWVTYAMCLIGLGTALQMLLPLHLRLSADKKATDGARRAVKTITDARPGSGPSSDILGRAAATSLVMALTVVSFLNAGLASEAATRARASTGGWELVAEAAQPADLPKLIESLGSAAIAAPVGAFNMDARNAEGRTVRVEGLRITSEYLDRTPMTLSARTEGLATDADVYQRVINESGTAVVDQNLFTDGSTRNHHVRVGETLFLRELRTGRTLTVTVVGLARSTGTLARVLVGPSTATALRGGEWVAERVLLAPTDPKSVSDRSTIDKVLSGPDVTYRPIDDPVNERNLDATLVRRSLRSLSWLGGLLVVSVLSVLFVHGVSERRKDWSVLRSLGMSSPGIRRLAVSEALHRLVPAVLVGWLAGVAVAWRLVWAGALGIGASYPFSILSIIGALTVIAVPAIFVSLYMRRSLSSDAPLRR